MKKYLLLFSLATLQTCTITPASENSLECANKEDIQNIYQLMKDMHDFFMLYKIDYWISSGTLLGAVRHAGLIPWDDDLDVCIDKKDEEKLLNLMPVLENLGYKIIGMWFGYKIYPINGIDIEQLPWKYPFFDIFLMEHSGDTYTYSVHWGAKRDGKPPHFKSSEIFPLKQYVFGPIIVMGPNNPYPELDAWYGADWNSVAYRGYDHKKEQRKEKKCILLTPQDKKPARIYKPLLHRVNRPSIKYWPADFQEEQAMIKN